MKQSRSTSDTGVARILVVDDTEDNLYLMQALLEDRYEVVLAQSGRAALTEMVSAKPPDMVLLDIMMPDMDGYEVLRRIRQDPSTADIPVIFVTALASQQDQRLGMDLGAVDYLTKPIDPVRILARVEAHMAAALHARRIEALQEKLARHLSPQAWRHLFRGHETQPIRFEQRVQTVLFTQTALQGSADPRDSQAFGAEVLALAGRHGGTVDRFVAAAAVVCFDEPAACVRMALDLHRTARAVPLRMGIHTGIMELARFPLDDEVVCTLMGDEAAHVVRVAITAATGSIAVSRETYAVVCDQLDADALGSLRVEEFLGSDLAHDRLTSELVRREQFVSTFAGLS